MIVLGIFFSNLKLYEFFKLISLLFLLDLTDILLLKFKSKLCFLFLIELLLLQLYLLFLFLNKFFSFLFLIFFKSNNFVQDSTELLFS